MYIKHLVTITLLVLSSVAYAQFPKPVTFTNNLKTLNDSTIEVSFVGVIDSGWHVYGANLEGDGPTSTSFNIDTILGCEINGDLIAVGNEKSQYDEMFGMQVRYFENKVTFKQLITLTGDEYKLKGYLEYGACNNSSCIPPTTVDIDINGQTIGAVNHAKPNIVETAQPDNTQFGQLWEPTNTIIETMPTQNTSLWLIFWSCFLFGLLALLTPCVWPIIPMTVSFFLKRTNNRSKGITDSITYGLSIFVIYISLGLAITYIAGPNALNALSTNAIFNLFFTAMLIVFGISFLGAFEITLPSAWSNAVDAKAEKTTGLISIFLMAFTLVLVSFSCTGPIIGFLLVQISTTGNFVAPTIGMAGFAIALALPFTLFALFPSWLNKMPKSGNWMITIKVVLGFIELAFSLKFLSVADLAYGWHILDRETFIVIWAALAITLGIYLFGKLKLAHDNNDSPIGIVRLLCGIASIAFAIYLIPGLWGAPLKAVSAFVPPMYTQDFDLDKSTPRAKFTVYEEGMKYAKEVGKPVIVDFTGHGCVNCREMEQAVWTDKRVAQSLNNDFILISLYVDDKTPLEERITVEENGNQRTLRTVGDKWSYLQSRKFGLNTQPLYTALDANGEMLTQPISFDKNVDNFLSFLNKSLNAYNK